LVSFLFADYCFAQQIDGESDSLPSLFAQRFHYVIRVAPGDELPRHSGDIPAQELSTDDRNDARERHPGADKRGETIAHVGEVFVEMLHDIGAAPERSENVDETEHLHFEMFVAHRELHHPLIKSRLAENRFRMAINQIKNLGAASLNLGLQETHVRIVNRASPLAKSAAAAHSPPRQ